jgi:hypothetical protein
MQRVSVICPRCGKAFETSDLYTKKGAKPVVSADETDDAVDDELVIPDFGFSDDESTDVEIADDSGELLAKTEINDMKLIDGE